MTDSIFLGAALDYVDRGVAVIPLKACSKEPATKNGLNDWSDNPEQLSFWWGRNPNFNVAGVLGQVSGGLVAIDLDVHDEAHSGVDFLREWQVEHGELPETWTSITGSGGKQLFYRVDREIKNSANGSIGVDIRGDGGYVVLPPSIHPNGEPYEWSVSPDDCDVADATPRVYAFIDAVRPSSTGGGGDRKPRFQLPDKIDSNRNDTLYKYMCSLRESGRSTEEMGILARAVNDARCVPPLSSIELNKIVKSASRYDPGNKGRKPREEDGAQGGDQPSFRKPKKGGGHFEGILTNELAKVVMDKYRARLIDGAPAVWTGKRWDFGPRAISRAVLELADDAKKQDKAEVQSYIMDKALSVTSDESFDGRYYVQFSDATVDAYTLGIVEPTPEMFICATLPVEWRDGGEGPNLADAFLDSVAGGDADVVQALREVAGACMCSRRALSQSPMLIGRAGGARGKASNGKSTYINWVRSILGSANVSSLDIATMSERFNGARLVGKLANLGDDIPDGFLDGRELSMFKKVVTGDSIYTDVKNGEGFEFRPSATMVFSMNAMPRLSDTTEGVFRRLAFIPFRRRFTPGDGDYDPELADKLARPEVMRRMCVLSMLALRGLIDRGGVLAPIPDMVEEVEEVRQDNNSAARWVTDEGIDVNWFNGRAVSDVYDQYVAWCERSGERNPFSKIRFGKQLRDTTFGNWKLQTCQKKVGGKVVKSYSVEFDK